MVNDNGSAAAVTGTQKEGLSRKYENKPRRAVRRGKGSIRKNWVRVSSREYRAREVVEKMTCPGIPKLKMMRMAAKA